MPAEPSGANTRTTMLVKQIRSETPRVVSLTLIDPSGAAVPQWEPGAHIELVLPSGIIRQYSLCGDDQHKTSYTIAVLHEPAGRGGSREVHNTALVGKELTVAGPRNHFALEPADEYLLIAGGIGITPILAMARALERTGKYWRAVYCGHHRNMAFVEELRGINPDRVSIIATDQRGRPDLRSLLGGLTPGTAVYCCGPPSLIADVSACCDQAGRQLTVRVERFVGDPAARPVSTGGDGPIEVELAISGSTITVPAEQTILDAVRAIRPDVPYSCEEGYCGSCETRVLHGIPDHRDEVLGAVERASNNAMMICVSRAKSDRLVLDL